MKKTQKFWSAPDKPEPATLDSQGNFKISVDRTEGVLVAAQFDSAQMAKPVNVVKGRTADSVYAQIVAMGLVSRLDHAAYLGNELAKAEIALRIGKAYVQDSLLIKNDKGGYLGVVDRYFLA